MKKIEAWQTDDGRVFGTEVEAAEHEFRAYAVELFGVAATEMILSSSVTDELFTKLIDLKDARSRAAPRAPWPAGMKADADDTTISGEPIVARRPVVSGSFGDFPPPARNEAGFGIGAAPADKRFDVEGQRVIAAGGVVAVAEAPGRLVPRAVAPMGVGQFMVSEAIVDAPQNGPEMHLIRQAVHIIGEPIRQASGDYLVTAKSSHFRHVVIKGVDPIPLYRVEFDRQSDGTVGLRFVEIQKETAA
jgi:hypothetical protein